MQHVLLTRAAAIGARAWGRRLLYFGGIGIVFPIAAISACSSSTNDPSTLSTSAVAPLPPGLKPDIEALTALGYVGVTDHPRTSAEGVVFHEAARASKGYNLYNSGHAPEAVLMDMDGTVLHRWSLRLRDIWPALADAEQYRELRFFRRVHLLSSGELLVIFEGLGIAKLDRSSKVIWARANQAHHDAKLDHNGNIVTLTFKVHLLPDMESATPIREDFITVLDSAGRLLKRFSMIDAARGTDFEWILTERASRGGDIFHTNSIHVLDGRLEASVQAFRRGNILTSMQAISAIAVVDPELEKVVWAHRGEYQHQHDPEITPTGSLLLFDNAPESGASVIREYNPATMEEIWNYKGSPELPFYSARAGTSQRLENGNTLITSSEQGRAFEVTAQGEIVWEFINPATPEDATNNTAVIFDLERLPVAEAFTWLSSESMKVANQ